LITEDFVGFFIGIKNKKFGLFVIQELDQDKSRPK